ncbi:MAG TPA: tRNA epoxyqueuosine(34) reductase QueG, partial [Xanthomonadales bacterium]|nr:tRNA epoxyqueuosine(34) reductase QueG [Xanthomonadales bacterium]
MADIRTWALDLGFQQIGVSDIDLERAESRLREWLSAGYHGRMDYMSRHGTKRSRPQELVPGTLRIITARMDYLPQSQAEAIAMLDDERQAYVS